MLYGELSQSGLPAAMREIAFFELSSSCSYSDGSGSTQDKLEDRITMQNLETNYDYFNFLGQVSPPKGDNNNNRERKTKPHSGGDG